MLLLLLLLVVGMWEEELRDLEVERKDLMIVVFYFVIWEVNCKYLLGMIIIFIYFWRGWSLLKMDIILCIEDMVLMWEM